MVHKIYGLFLDGSVAFPELSKRIEGSQKVYESQGGLSVKEQDEIEYFYGGGSPHQSDSLLLHYAKQGEVKERNGTDAENTGLLGNFCLVLINEYWESTYRKLIADDMGLAEAEDLQIDIFGDIRNFRHVIIHEKGVIDKKASQNKILKFYTIGEKILLKREMIKK